MLSQPPEQRLIGGEGIIVEGKLGFIMTFWVINYFVFMFLSLVDESVFGKWFVSMIYFSYTFYFISFCYSKYNKGSPVGRHQTWVLGGKERGGSNVFLIPCPENKRSKRILQTLIIEHIKVGKTSIHIFFTDNFSLIYN